MHWNLKNCGIGIISQHDDVQFIKGTLKIRQQPPEYDTDHYSKIILVYNRKFGQLVLMQHYFRKVVSLNG